MVTVEVRMEKPRTFRLYYPVRIQLDGGKKGGVKVSLLFGVARVSPFSTSWGW